MNLNTLAKKEDLSMKTFQKDQLTVKIYPTREEMGREPLMSISSISATSALIHTFPWGIDAPGDIGRLFVDGNQNAAGGTVKAVFRTVIADA